MTEHEQTTQTEQPAAADSATGQSLQAGGITPQVEAALANVPPQVAVAIREELSQKNARVEEVQRNAAAQRQALEQDVQMAGVMRECMKDSEFAEYLQHRENGTLSTFFRQKSGTPVQQQVTEQTESSSIASDASDGTEGATSVPGVENLNQRIARIERERAQAAQEREINDFAGRHPDYKDYLPLMRSVRQRNQGATLEDLYLTAKGMVAEGIANTASAGAADQQENETSGGPAQSSSPPLPLGNPPGSSTPAAPTATSMAAAFEAAKQAHGLDGEFRVSYE